MRNSIGTLMAMRETGKCKQYTNKENGAIYDTKHFGNSAKKLYMIIKQNGARNLVIYVSIIPNVPIKRIVRANITPPSFKQRRYIYAFQLIKIYCNVCTRKERRNPIREKIIV